MRPQFLSFSQTPSLFVGPFSLSPYGRHSEARRKLTWYGSTMMKDWCIGIKGSWCVQFPVPYFIHVLKSPQLAFTTLAMRTIVWSLQRKPYRRANVLISGTHTINDDVWSPPASMGQVAIDAFDLCCNLRGCGWNWSRGLQVPPEIRPTTSTTAFAMATFVFMNIHVLIFDIMHYSVQWFAPTTVGSPIGGSIFDPTIPPVHRYLRSSSMTLFSGLTIYCAISTVYLLCTLLGLLVFKQHLSLWPPAFRSPWFATSLTEYWAKCWHQAFRDNFISLGGKPLSKVAGRAGGVLGAFLMSGIFHDFGLWGMGRGSDFPSVGGFFLMMGVGVVLEGLWRKVSGRRTGGWIGRIWTLTWIIGWGNLLVDAWARKGLIGSLFLPTQLRPSTYIFGALSFT
jgi:hypothetical protein